MDDKQQPRMVKSFKEMKALFSHLVFKEEACFNQPEKSAPVSSRFNLQKSTKDNVFVIGLDAFNERLIKQSKNYRNHHIYNLCSFDEIKKWEIIDLQYQKMNEVLASFPSVDAFIGFWDFPVTLLQSHFCEKWQLPGATLKSVLKCEHKYWSRLEQLEVLPELVPPFQLVDPFEEKPNIELAYPYWLKPIKSTGSYLAFEIKNQQDLTNALIEIRNNINAIGDCFDYFCNKQTLPEPIKNIKGYFCLAESALSGNLYTVEGYVYNGEVDIHGIVQSIKEKGNSSFAYYMYPCDISEKLRSQLAYYTDVLIKKIGLDNTTFNIEYFYNKQTNKVSLLEINPRVSQSHCYLFDKVDNLNIYDLLIDVARGIKPTIPNKNNNGRIAAKFFLRHYQDGMVKRVPQEEEITAILSHYPESRINIKVHEGQRLSHLKEQDSYSFELANIYLTANNRASLLSNYKQCKQYLSKYFVIE